MRFESLTEELAIQIQVVAGNTMLNAPGCIVASHFFARDPGPTQSPSTKMSRDL